MKPTRWSYSSLSMYEECPAKWRYAYIDKLQQPASPAMERGTAMHKMCEDYLAGAIDDVPDDLRQSALILQRLKTRGGQPEKVWRLSADWTPVESASWVLAIVDVHFFVGDTLHVYDFKTGRAYPGHAKQLELYSLIGLATYPQMQFVQSAAIYLDGSKVGKPRTLSRVEAQLLRDEWTRRARALYADEELRASPGKGCYWCSFKDIAGGPCKEWRNAKKEKA